MQWTNTAFNIYMGNHDTMSAAEFEPVRRREVQIASLADTQCAQVVDARERFDTQRSVRPATATGRSMDRHPARG